jgi:predicted HAD superfamily Cof-like phosphohydrolase
MQKVLSQVEEFHLAFGVPVRRQPTGDLPTADWQLRFDLLAEENEEYREACQKGDLIKVADALGDLLYVLCGTLLTHGMQHKIEEVVTEIHRSNMSKLGPDGQPIRREDGKVLKSETYFRPDLQKIFTP